MTQDPPTTWSAGVVPGDQVEVFGRWLEVMSVEPHDHHIDGGHWVPSTLLTCRGCVVVSVPADSVIPVRRRPRRMAPLDSAERD